MLYSARVSPLERVPKIVLAQFNWHSMKTLAQCKCWRGLFGVVPTNHPALVLEVSSYKVGVLSWVSLLLSKGNLSLGIFSRLEKVAIISNLVN